MRIYQHYITGDDADRDGYAVNWIAQTFTPEENHLVAKLKLKLFRVGDPGEIIISIKNATLEKPSGGDLCSGTIEGTDLTLNSNGEWYEISLGNGFELKKNTQYAIVVRAPNGDVSNKVSWRTDSSSPTYAGGTYCGSSDSGVDWSTYSGSDAMFEEWGTGPPSPTTVCWGNLLKSQISSEKIEEAITRMIQNHEDDENAHVEAGESLYSHKASEIIDHIVDSIIADKIKKWEITVDKLTWDKFLITAEFESLDGWEQGGVGSESILCGLGSVSIETGPDDGDTAYIRCVPVNTYGSNPSFDDHPFMQVRLKIMDKGYAETHLHIGYSGFQVAGHDYIGFRFDENKIYAVCRDAVSGETETDITGDIDSELPHDYKVVWITSSKVEFYIDEDLKATIITNVPTGDDEEAIMFIGVRNSHNGGEQTIGPERAIFSQDT